MAAPADRERLIEGLPVPVNCSKEYWRFPDYARNPLIEIL
jgi:hypothetical protein